MPLVARKVWNNHRKWLGNLLPALFFVPPAAWGIYLMLRENNPLSSGLWFVLLGTLLGWIGLNLFGLYQNGFMRRELKRELTAKGVSFDDPHLFVGFASPRFVSVLDAHEDLGFLFLRAEYAEFIGEKSELKVPTNEITNIRFRPNIHTWVGLGRWICIEGVQKKTNFRMSLESREKNYLMLNLLESQKIKKQIQSWWRPQPPSEL